MFNGILKNVALGCLLAIALSCYLNSAFEFGHLKLSSRVSGQNGNSSPSFKHLTEPLRNFRHTLRDRIHLPKIFSFTEFKSKFSKHYKSLTEELRREKIFLTRYFETLKSHLAFRHRTRSIYLDLNEFSDWTQTERQSMLMTMDSDNESESDPDSDFEEPFEFGQGERFENKRRFKRDLTPASDDGNEQTEMLIDHRDCLNPVRNQHRCGACYIFSTIALYEWLHCKQNGNERNSKERLQFSEQYVLDCGVDRMKMEGCKHGYPDKVSEFIGKYGLDLRGNYPYRKRSDICPYPKMTGPNKMGYVKVNQQFGLLELKRFELNEFIQRSPIVINLRIDRNSFFDYGGGVEDGRNCGPPKEDSKRFTVHAMLIVGSGIEDGQEFWLIRNSFGKSWGTEEGHYKLNKKANCFLNNGFYVKVATGEKLFSEGFNKFYYVESIKRRFLDYKEGNGRMVREAPSKNIISS